MSIKTERGLDVLKRKTRRWASFMQQKIEQGLQHAKLNSENESFGSFVDRESIARSTSVHSMGNKHANSARPHHDRSISWMPDPLWLNGPPRRRASFSHPSDSTMSDCADFSSCRHSVFSFPVAAFPPPANGASANSCANGSDLSVKNRNLKNKGSNGYLNSAARQNMTGIPPTFIHGTLPMHYSHQSQSAGKQSQIQTFYQNGKNFPQNTENAAGCSASHAKSGSAATNDSGYTTQGNVTDSEKSARSLLKGSRLSLHDPSASFTAGKGNLLAEQRSMCFGVCSEPQAPRQQQTPQLHAEPNAHLPCHYLPFATANASLPKGFQSDQRMHSNAVQPCHAFRCPFPPPPPNYLMRPEDFALSIMSPKRQHKKWKKAKPQNGKKGSVPFPLDLPFLPPACSEAEWRQMNGCDDQSTLYGPNLGPAMRWKSFDNLMGNGGLIMRPPPSQHQVHPSIATHQVGGPSFHNHQLLRRASTCDMAGPRQSPTLTMEYNRSDNRRDGVQSSVANNEQPKSGASKAEAKKKVSSSNIFQKKNLHRNVSCTSSSSSCRSASEKRPTKTKKQPASATCDSSSQSRVKKSPRTKLDDDCESLKQNEWNEQSETANDYESLKCRSESQARVTAEAKVVMDRNAQLLSKPSTDENQLHKGDDSISLVEANAQALNPDKAFEAEARTKCSSTPQNSNNRALEPVLEATLHPHLPRNKIQPSAEFSPLDAWASISFGQGQKQIRDGTASTNSDSQPSVVEDPIRVTLVRVPPTRHEESNTAEPCYQEWESRLPEFKKRLIEMGTFDFNAAERNIKTNCVILPTSYSEDKSSYMQNHRQSSKESIAMPACCESPLREAKLDGLQTSQSCSFEPEMSASAHSTIRETTEESKNMERKSSLPEMKVEKPNVGFGFEHQFNSLRPLTPISNKLQAGESSDIDFSWVNDLETRFQREKEAFDGELERLRKKGATLHCNDKKLHGNGQTGAVVASSVVAHHDDTSGRGQCMKKQQASTILHAKELLNGAKAGSFHACDDGSICTTRSGSCFACSLPTAGEERPQNGQLAQGSSRNFSHGHLPSIYKRIDAELAGEANFDDLYASAQNHWPKISLSNQQLRNGYVCEDASFTFAPNYSPTLQRQTSATTGYTVFRGGLNTPSSERYNDAPNRLFQTDHRRLQTSSNGGTAWAQQRCPAAQSIGTADADQHASCRGRSIVSDEQSAAVPFENNVRLKAALFEQEAKRVNAEMRMRQQQIHRLKQRNRMQPYDEAADGSAERPFIPSPDYDRHANGEQQLQGNMLDGSCRYGTYRQSSNDSASDRNGHYNPAAVNGASAGVRHTNGHHYHQSTAALSKQPMIGYSVTSYAMSPTHDDNRNNSCEERNVLVTQEPRWTFNSLDRNMNPQP